MQSPTLEDSFELGTGNPLRAGKRLWVAQNRKRLRFDHQLRSSVQYEIRNLRTIHADARQPV
jgi:hypothetical protein